MWKAKTLNKSSSCLDRCQEQAPTDRIKNFTNVKEVKKVKFALEQGI